MRIKTQKSDYNQHYRLQSSDKKLSLHKKSSQSSRTQHNILSAHSIISSQIKNNNYIAENDYGNDNIQQYTMEYFKQKYLLRDGNQNDIKEEMMLVLNRKKNQLQSLRIYRDQLKFISRSSQYNQPIKLSVQILRQKAQVEENIAQCKIDVQRQLKQTNKQIEMLAQYQKFMNNFIQCSNNNNQDYLDLSKQEEVMLKNLQIEKQMLVRELAEEQRKNSKEIKQIQDQILSFRIMIKDKEDNLRNLKAKICTLYIKLHSRNNSRTGSKSKDRNMSLSIRKFNSNNHSSVKQAFIGNNTFKNYSKQIIQRVSNDQQLVKIKFFLSSPIHNENKNKQQLFFQCFYKNKEGQLHDERNQDAGHDQDMTRDKVSADTTLKSQQIYVKYLSSMKFFYKSKIVGVQCRVKTEKGNKHIYIGNCQPNVEHELLTLVNKKIITLGSFWHSKQMIGISVWYTDRLKAVENVEKSKKKIQQQTKKQAYNQYYS